MSEKRRSKADRQVGVAAMADWNNSLIAAVFGVSTATIEQDRKELGIPARKGMKPWKPHGAGGYNRGCRCAVCVQSMRDRAEIAKKARASHTLAADDPRHGTPAGYRYCCRCGPCRAAYAVVNAESARRRMTRLATDERTS